MSGSMFRAMGAWLGGDRRSDEARARAKVRDSRGRGLANLERAFGRDRLHEAVARALGESSPRALELGCGEGRALLEMAKAWPALELHGVNRRPWPGMVGSESLRGSAVELGLFTPAEAAALRPPEIHFTDASALPLPDRAVDLVVSQVALHYVKRKDRVLTEVWRVLRPGGLALLHLDTTVDDPPDFLDHPTPRFQVRLGGGRQGALEDVLAPIAADGFDLRVERVASQKAGRERVHVVMRRNRDAPLPLALGWCARSSFNLARLTAGAHQDLAWGYRSVFLPEPSGAPRA